MTNKYDWLLKKNIRSVDNLKLWGQNPRLDPDNQYHTIRDFAEEMTIVTSDREALIDLAKSFVERGFIPADPIVIWQSDENQKYYVAEGNRRVLVLKLLRAPLKAPKSIRSVFLKLSAKINIQDFEKIPVAIAPSFEDAEWYISQRNSTTSLQLRWANEQQRRWIAELYDKYSGDVAKIKLITNISESELQNVFRILKLKEFVKDIKEELSEEEYQNAASIRFPLTTLERFFSFKDVRDQWGIEFDGYDIKINSDQTSFLYAFSHLIKKMLLPRGNGERIDSRTIRTAENVVEIMKSLPAVNIIPISEEPSITVVDLKNEDQQSQSKDLNESIAPIIDEKSRRNKLKNDPHRIRVIPDFYVIETDSFKIQKLFEELQQIPPNKYPNSVAASIRIFLDLAVLKFIESENLKDQICAFYNSDLRSIILSKRLEYLKQSNSGLKNNSIIEKLLNQRNQYSLDVLNGYVHGEGTHFLNLNFLNGFWDFMFPLFEKLLVIKEID